MAKNQLIAQLKSDEVVAQFEATAGQHAKAFAGEVAISIMGNPALEKATLSSIIVEATKASALGLSLLPSMGEAYLVPYKGAAQFQLGYKGLIQLAMRSGQMKAFGAVPVYEGENPKWDKYTQELIHEGEETGQVVGYYAFFELVTGFRKAEYWSKKRVEDHKNKFSKSKSGPWSTDFEAMALKTVLKSILQYAPKSTEMARAIAEDTEVEYTQAKDITPFEIEQAPELFSSVEQASISETSKSEQTANEDVFAGQTIEPTTDQINLADEFFGGM
ncbi:recombinase RecT [Weissella soli]|uniref:recombinase RecT n=1 Tax=Weissella soli TaxID=155866 RepID=UPI003C784217